MKTGALVSYRRNLRSLLLNQAEAARWVSLALVLGGSSLALASGGAGSQAIGAVAPSQAGVASPFKPAKRPTCKAGDIPCVCHGGIWCTTPSVCQHVCGEAEGLKPCEDGSVVGTDGACHPTGTKNHSANGDQDKK
jgi:hypothetical protein